MSFFSKGPVGPVITLKFDSVCLCMPNGISSLLNKLVKKFEFLNKAFWTWSSLILVSNPLLLLSKEANLRLKLPKLASSGCENN